MNITRTEFLAGKIYAVGNAANEQLPKISLPGNVQEFAATYLAKGFDQLADINGDFCGAIRRKNKWTLFRDHMGVRTLYYYLKGKDFAFAEDMRDLCAMDGIDLSINERLFYLRARGANTNTLTETDFQYIQCVQPGSYTDFEETEDGWKVTVHPYWIPGQKKIRYDTEQEYINRLRELVEDAVKIRLDAVEGPVGAELSGGLDSGVIDILIARSGREAKYVSWSAPYDVIPMQPVDERQVIEDICKQEGITFSFLPLNDDSTDAIYRRLPPFVNTSDISKTSRFFSEQGIHIVFSGHGGDEGASHRANLLELWYHHEYRDYIREIWNARKGHHFRIIGTTARVTKGVLFDLPKRKGPWQNKDHDLIECLNKDFLKKMRRAKFPALTFSYDPLQDILTGGCRDRLDNCAVQGADYTVRYLFPLLDYRIIDYCVSIPRTLFIRNGKNRYIYREAFKNIMPESLYRVNYKDYASIRGLRKTGSARIKSNQEHRNKKESFFFLDTLEWKIWRQYLDKDTCYSPEKKKSEITSNSRVRERSLMNFCFYCQLLQGYVSQNGNN